MSLVIEQTPEQVVQNLTPDRRAALLRKPGLMLGLRGGSPNAERAFRDSLDWLAAAAAQDISYLRTAQAKYMPDLVNAYNSDQLSRMEFKTLAPAIEGTNNIGGYNVPVPLATEISRNLAEYSIPRQFFRFFPMERKTLTIAGISVKPTVAVAAEDTAIAASKPTLDLFTLTAKKLAAIYAGSNEYIRDANVDVLLTILEVFGEQFGIQESKGALQNAATNWNGLLWYGAGVITSGIAANGAIAVSRSNSATGGKTGYPQIGDTVGATDIWTDMMYMMQQQPMGLYKDGVFFIDQNVLVAALSLRSTQGLFVANSVTGLSLVPAIDGGTEMYYCGYKIVPVPSGVMFTYDASAHVSAPFLALCNPQRSWMCMGMNGGFEVEYSNDATVDAQSAFEYDLTLMRMKERVAFGIARPETVVVLRADAS